MSRKILLPIVDKFPRLPRKYDRRYKLSEKQIQSIKKLKKDGLSVKVLAKRFKVSGTTICYYVYPDVMARMKEKNRKRIHLPKDKERYNENKRRQRKDNYKKVRKYLNFLQRKRRGLKLYPNS
jgi:hypothetical protein